MEIAEGHLATVDGKCWLYIYYCSTLNSYAFFIVYIYYFILVQAFDAMNLNEVDGGEFDHEQQRAFQDLQRENRELRQTVQDLQKTLRQREVIPLLLFLMSICMVLYYTSNVFKIWCPFFSDGVEGLEKSKSRWSGEGSSTWRRFETKRTGKGSPAGSPNLLLIQ